MPELLWLALAILAGFGLLAWAILRHGSTDGPRRADKKPDPDNPTILRLRRERADPPPDGPDAAARSDMPIVPERWRREQ